MAFETAKLNDIDIDIELIKERIDHIIQGSPPKITLLSEATIRDQHVCAHDQESNTIFLNITSDELVYRDGYVCYAMVDHGNVIFIECSLHRYSEHSELFCKTINIESERTINRLKEALLCLGGKNTNNIFTLRNKAKNDRLTNSRDEDRSSSKKRNFYFVMIMFLMMLIVSWLHIITR